MMQTELVNLSTAYLMGWKTIQDYAEWLAGIEWDDPNLDPEILNFVGRMELLATEILEGLRPEAEFWQEVAEFVARETGSVYSQQTLTTAFAVSNSSTDIPIRSPELMVLAVGGSQSWNISPLPVSA
jgi:hypothetical protein